VEPTFVDEFTRPFTLEPTSTALVVVDMQYASGSREYGLGRLLAQQGRLAEAEYRFGRIANLIIPNTQRLLECFRALEAKVIFITLGPEAADYSDAPRHLRRWFEATHNHAGNKEHEIVAELQPQANEMVFNKVTIGAFGSTGIDSYLKANGIQAVVVTGVSTNNCVGMTAMEAADRQYGAVLVSDATGTCSDAMQEATLASFRRLWGRVMGTDEVIAELKRQASAAPAAIA
jgi:nicotinamidase-related amidase